MLSEGFVNLVWVVANKATTASASDWFSFCADVASIVSLLLSFIIWRQTRSIKQSIASRLRLPELNHDLQSVIALLTSELGLLPGSAHDCRKAVERVKSLLGNIRQKTKGPERNHVQDLLQRIQRWQRMQVSGSPKSPYVEELWTIREGLEGVAESLNQLRKDQSKEF